MRVKAFQMMLLIDEVRIHTFITFAACVHQQLGTPSVADNCSPRVWVLSDGVPFGFRIVVYGVIQKDSDVTTIMHN